MEQTEIAREVEAFVKSNYLLDDEKVLEHKESLIVSGVVDSTGILELITYLEGRYRLRFEDSELTADNFESVSKIAEFVCRKIKQDRPTF